MKTAAWTAFLLVGIVVVPRGSAAEPDLFTTKVRPILARNCFKCHGPDDKTRKSGLRLDRREDALKAAKSGNPAIVPGKPDESEFLNRVFSDDPGEVMPPPQTKLSVSESDKQILKQWINDGAPYKAHWAFESPRQTEPPKARTTGWVRNPIDAFVLARLEAEGLTPSPRADKSTLIRRLSLDLIGLPPTLEEIDRFFRDDSPDAYEKLVDRLLESPHYGERWARKWLDLARYADSNGYEKDRARSIWPYRDWVIQAINADKPFDQFTIEQIAGDMLPNATNSQRIATGFHRNTMLNEEGGIDPLEFRYYAMTDRVATTATTWLGLTVGCAQCHTHKYDPIPQREYYQFMALMDNADEPEIQVSDSAITRKRRELEREIAARIDDLPNQFPIGEKTAGKSDDQLRKENLEKSFQAWVDQAEKEAVRWTVLNPLKATSDLPHLTIENDGVVFVSGDQSKRDVYTLDYSTTLQGVTAIRLEALPDERLPSGGPGRVYYEGPSGDFFLSEITASNSAGKLPLRVASNLEPRTKDGKKGVDIRAAFPTGQAVDGDPQTGWTINGGQGKPHVAIFHFAEPLQDASKFTIELLFERYHAANLGKFRISATTDARPFLPSTVPAELEPILLIPSKDRSQEQTSKLLRHYLSIAPELANARQAIEAIRKREPNYPTTLVFQERPSANPRVTFVHNRGEYLQPTERVSPGVFSMLPALPKSEAATRLALARWLVSSENPLTPRVVMNRQWAAFFGRGIVRTTEDFGYQGEAPTHPELLDWLAGEFIKSGWSMKAMHKRIVMSATYQQSSNVTPKLLVKDSTNQLLSRGPRFRLEAEQLRDQALRVSGLLSEKVGGPSVFPPQPPGVSTEGSYGGIVWNASPGEDRYRRGLYTFSKRTSPYAMFSTFDGPSGEFCLARREVSNTPLQSLTLLNDPVFHEAAQALGGIIANEKGTVDERIALLIRRCLARSTEPEELRQFERFYQSQRDRLIRKELDGATIAGPGNGDVFDRALWTLLARVILNLDEMITKG